MYGEAPYKGIYGVATGGNGAKAVFGEATGLGAVGNSGGRFVAYGDSGTGVSGSAPGPAGAGVSGAASATGDVENYGGTFGAGGNFGCGVYAIATGEEGKAVKGYAADHGDVTNYGGHFYAAGGNGRGVYAKGKIGGYFECSGGANSVGLFAQGGVSSGYAAEFRGKVLITDLETGGTVMELGSGLDYAEGFDVSEGYEITSGSVLIIDPDNPGKLTLSDKPYDSKVAGIVAGAKGMGSGVRLGGEQFDHDVALAGRVYCNVDATYGPIEPGDLLTTSSTPGYAMKVTDYTQAQGAILGKAMERLEKGQQGQILVLVTLQ